MLVCNAPEMLPSINIPGAYKNPQALDFGVVQVVLNHGLENGRGSWKISCNIIFLFEIFLIFHHMPVNPGIYVWQYPFILQKNILLFKSKHQIGLSGSLENNMKIYK